LLNSKEKHTQPRIERVEKTRHKEIGAPDLSFRTVTDEVGKSPIVCLDETLVSEGYQVNTDDENVDPDRRISANKGFLGRELPHIALLMRLSIDNIIEEPGAAVMANGSAAFCEAHSSSMRMRV